MFSVELVEKIIILVVYTVFDTVTTTFITERADKLWFMLHLLVVWFQIVCYFRFYLTGIW